MSDEKWGLLFWSVNSSVEFTFPGNLLFQKESPGEEDPILKYEVDGTSITTSAFFEQAKESMAEVKQGEYTTLKELKKESEEWLNRTR